MARTKKNPGVVELILTETLDKYRTLNDFGFTHADFAKATGLPDSHFSMVLTGYRKVSKIVVLDKMIDGLSKLNAG